MNRNFRCDIYLINFILTTIIILLFFLCVYFHNYFYKTGHVQVGKEYYYNGLKSGIGKNFGSRSLNIQNVNTEDEGNYICEVTVHSGHKNHATHVLKIFSEFY